MTTLTQPISCGMAGTLDGLFRSRCQASPGREAYRFFSRKKEIWQSVTWQDMANLVSRWQNTLKKVKLNEGDRVALQLKNGIDWIAFEQAALGLGLVVVPLYPDDRADNVAYILRDAGVKALLIQDNRQWNRLANDIDDIKNLEHIYILSKPSSQEKFVNDKLCYAEDCLVEKIDRLHERGGDPQKMASIVYTSGTTGRPKGVMLSHYNILFDTDAVLTAFNVEGSKLRLLSFLPLSHMYERTIGYYLPMMAGATVTYARSVQQLAEDLKQIQPTMIVTVPRIFERFYDKLQQKLKTQSIIKKQLFRLAISIGWRHFKYQQKQARYTPLLLLKPLLNKLIAEKIQALLGGKMLIAASGGAALPDTVARTFIGLGINIFQGYGMTESSPAATMNTFKLNRPDSVGEKVPGVELRIGENDELQISGPTVMLGYWNNHQATTEIITSDGWLRTGDKAKIIDNSVYITGRIKDILIMSNGEKIPPVDMEQAICLEPTFEQTLIIGEGKAYLSAIIVLNGENWPAMAQQHGLDPLAEASLSNKKLHSVLLKRIAAALHDFPGYAKVRKLYLTLEPWTIENDLMTPTMKIKRAKVVNKYQKEIERIYSN